MLVLSFVFCQDTKSLLYVNVKLSSNKHNKYNCVIDRQSGVTVWEYNNTISIGVGGLDKSI
jgi:hypothetical protein